MGKDKMLCSSEWLVATDEVVGGQTQTQSEQGRPIGPDLNPIASYADNKAATRHNETLFLQSQAKLLYLTHRKHLVINCSQEIKRGMTLRACRRILAPSSTISPCPGNFYPVSTSANCLSSTHA